MVVQVGPSVLLITPAALSRVPPPPSKRNGARTAQGGSTRNGANTPLLDPNTQSIIIAADSPPIAPTTCNMLPSPFVPDVPGRKARGFLKESPVRGEQSDGLFDAMRLTALLLLALPGMDSLTMMALPGGISLAPSCVGGGMVGLAIPRQPRSSCHLPLTILRCAGESTTVRTGVKRVLSASLLATAVLHMAQPAAAGAFHAPRAGVEFAQSSTGVDGDRPPLRWKLAFTDDDMGETDELLDEDVDAQEVVAKPAFAESVHEGRSIEVHFENYEDMNYEARAHVPPHCCVYLSICMCIH